MGPERRTLARRGVELDPWEGDVPYGDPWPCLLRRGDPWPCDLRAGDLRAGDDFEANLVAPDEDPFAFAPSLAAAATPFLAPYTALDSAT